MTTRFHLLSKVGALLVAAAPNFDKRWNRTSPGRGRCRSHPAFL